MMNLKKINIELKLPSKAKKLLSLLKEERNDIYLVGGFVRDLILGNLSYDLDFIVVDKSAIELSKELASKLDGNWFLLDELTETTRLVLKDENSKSYTFDFTPVLKPNLEDDFARRDFTINALAINLKEPEVLIDKFSGLDDLKQKRIKVIKLNNLLDDPLRFIRAFRFATLLKGEIEKETLLFIKNNLESFNDSVASERISHELWKMLDNDYSFKYMKQISEVGLLEKIIPELTPMRKVTPNDHHHLWLYDHSIELIKTFEENFSKLPIWVKEELNKPFGLLDLPKKKAVVKLGCVLHDVGKPKTWEIKNIDGKEKHTFYGHDKLGAEIASKIAERLKFSSSIQATLSKLIQYHLRPFQLQQGNAPISERALYRFFRDVGDDTPLLLSLAMADLYATCGPKITKEDLEEGEKLILFLFNAYEKHKTKEEIKLKKPKLLDGNEIMELTGLKPTPKLGEIVKDLDEAIAVGEVMTKEDAKKWVKNKLK